MSSGRNKPPPRKPPRPRGGSPSPAKGPSGARQFEQIPTRDRIERAATALRQHGFDVVVVSDARAAREEVLSRVAPTDVVLEAHSQTLREVGLTGPEAPSGRYVRLRPQLEELTKQGRANERRRLGAAPQVVMGSVHAVAETGEMVVASGSGSQLGPYAYGAERVIWVVGAQKIVRTLADALRRVEEYALPREDARMRELGRAGSTISKLLVLRSEHQPHRALVVLVADRLGV